jgi:hypothetical protein
MHLTYLILAHRDLAQVANLIDALKAPFTSFYIHFDIKMNVERLRDYAVFTSKNVHVMKSRLNVNWGGYNMISATLQLLKSALQQKGPGYLILLSGQDLPLKSNDEICNFYRQNYGKQYIEFFSLPYKSWTLNGGLDRVNYFWFIDQVGQAESIKLYHAQKTSVMQRPFFESFTVYGGSQWWSMTKECGLHILKFIWKRNDYNEFMKYCFVPDELYFQNIILNSPFMDHTVNNSLRYIDWNKGPEFPRILTVDDYQSMKTSDCLFARKFDGKVDNAIIHKIINGNKDI